MQPLNGKWIFEAECFQRRLQPFKNIYTCTQVFLRIWHFLFIPHCWWQLDDQSSAPSTNIQISKSINNHAKQCREDLGVILSADIPTSLKTNTETRHHLPAIEKKKKKYLQSSENSLQISEWNFARTFWPWILITQCFDFHRKLLIAFDWFIYLLQHIFTQIFFWSAIPVLFSKCIAWQWSNRCGGL